ncbi:putative squalene-hopene-cyclase [Aspergillus egyptiacus]|nr:putative squalene-hopene-cyclase [Aspergillus egyptiacus]
MAENKTPENPATLLPQVQLALQKGTAYSFQRARDDGHWYGETGSNISATAEYVLLLHTMGLEHTLDREPLIAWLLSEQQPDGSWSLAPGLHGNISMTTEAYLALKLLGLSPDHHAMSSARQFALSHGGVARVRMLTRIYLAMVGLFPWKHVPQLPAELVLAPASAPINIYRLSSWARDVTVPLLIIRHREPIYALPNGASANNDYLDELWCDPANKLAPYTPADGWNLTRLCFLAADYSLHLFAPVLRHSPLRWRARRKCVRWLLERQNEDGNFGGSYPATAQAIMALRLEGFTPSSPPVSRALAALKGFIWRDGRGLRMQIAISPVWDTALMTVALCDAGVSGEKNAQLAKAMEWVKQRQILATPGDWSVYRPDVKPGGFAFQYYNLYHPDLDDTAAVLQAMVKQDGSSVTTVPVLRAVEFLLGLQSRNGGWAAYEADNDSVFLNDMPFADMDNLADPPTTDVTGRVVEAFGLVLESSHPLTKPKPGLVFDPSFAERIRAAVHRAIAFLRRNQESTGAWYGRWGINYVFGTFTVLCGLAHFAHEDDVLRIEDMVAPALAWLKSVQNADGGWGESPLSYHDPQRYAGVGPSTPSQTAWGVMGLLAFLPATDPAILRGIRHLLDRQTEQCGAEAGASWPEHLFTATGFPNTFYMKYELYPLYFPLMALGRWARAMGSLQPGGSNPK